MLIYDESGNLLENPDLQNGKLVKLTRVKADAKPVDDETKFAWDEDDYEEYAVYKPNVPEENIEREIASCVRELNVTDYVPCKTVDMLTTCTNIDDMTDTLSVINKEYSEVLARREELRDRINTLRTKLAQVKNV